MYTVTDLYISISIIERQFEIVSVLVKFSLVPPAVLQSHGKVLFSHTYFIFKLSKFALHIGQFFTQSFAVRFSLYDLKYEKYVCHIAFSKIAYFITTYPSYLPFAHARFQILSR